VPGKQPCPESAEPTRGMKREERETRGREGEKRDEERRGEERRGEERTGKRRGREAEHKGEVR